MAPLEDAKDEASKPTAVPTEKIEKAAPVPAAEENEEEVSELQGQPAPPFTLGLFGLGQADLAAHKGKEIVVLDFWATWCGPCVMALPILTEVTDAYSNKGVVFYAVNERDDPVAVRDFLRCEEAGRRGCDGFGRKGR